MPEQRLRSENFRRKIARSGRVRRRERPHVYARSWAWSVMLSADSPVSDSADFKNPIVVKVSGTATDLCRYRYYPALPQCHGPLRKNSMKRLMTHYAHYAATLPDSVTRCPGGHESRSKLSRRSCSGVVQGSHFMVLWRCSLELAVTLYGANSMDDGIEVYCSICFAMPVLIKVHSSWRR